MSGFDRDPDDPLLRYEETTTDDPFSFDDPEAREREQRRLERERRRREREQRGAESRRSLGERVRGLVGGDGRPEPEPEPEPVGERSPQEAVPEPPRREPEPAPPPRTEPEPVAAVAAVPLRDLPPDPEPAIADEPGPRVQPQTTLTRPPGGAVRRRRALALGALAVGAAVVWLLVALFQPFTGDGSGKVVVEIPKGATADEIADILDDKGVISSAALFRVRLSLSGHGDDIEAGTYTLASGMSYSAAIDTLTAPPGTNQITVTVPEGYTIDQIDGLAADAGLEGDYKKAASQAQKDFDLSKYGAGDADTLEGFLFPATYDLKPGSSAEDLVAQQLAAFERSIKQVDLEYAQSKNLSTYDVVTIASMIDREVQVPDERELVSAVIYNRLADGTPLGIDATLRYALDNYDKPLTESDLQTDSPYNTRLVAGLPPTPIGNPGLDSLKAAAHPADVNYLYYVVKPCGNGSHVFTASASEFEKAAAAYQQALKEQGGSPTDC